MLGRSVGHSPSASDPVDQLVSQLGLDMEASHGGQSHQRLIADAKAILRACTTSVTGRFNSVTLACVALVLSSNRNPGPANLHSLCQRFSTLNSKNFNNAVNFVKTNVPFISQTSAINVRNLCVKFDALSIQHHVENLLSEYARANPSTNPSFKSGIIAAAFFHIAILHKIKIPKKTLIEMSETTSVIFHQILDNLITSCQPFLDNLIPTLKTYKSSPSASTNQNPSNSTSPIRRPQHLLNSPAKPSPLSKFKPITAGVDDDDNDDDNRDDRDIPGTPTHGKFKMGYPPHSLASPLGYRASPRGELMMKPKTPSTGHTREIDGNKTSNENTENLDLSHSQNISPTVSVNEERENGGDIVQVVIRGEKRIAKAVVKTGSPATSDMSYTPDWKRKRKSKYDGEDEEGDSEGYNSVENQQIRKMISRALVGHQSVVDFDYKANEAKRRKKYDAWQEDMLKAIEEKLKK